jgi:hypothetical protein
LIFRHEARLCEAEWGMECRMSCDRRALATGGEKKRDWYGVESNPAGKALERW